MKWKDLKNQTWFPYTVATCAAVVLFAVLWHLPVIGKALQTVISFFTPVIIGVVLAYIIDPLVSVFENKVFGKMKARNLARVLGVVIALVIVAAFVALVIVALIPQIGSSIVTFSDNLDGYIAHTEAWFDSIRAKIPFITWDLTAVIEMGKESFAKMSEKLPDVLDTLGKASSVVGGALINFILGGILAIYFLLDKHRLMNTARYFLNLWLGNDRYNSLGKFWSRCNAIMIKYIVCEFLEALIIGLTNFIMMQICRMPYAILISVIVGITNMIPTFGPIVGAVIGGFILVLVDPVKALIFIIFTVVLQAIDGYILKPKMYGDTLGVPSILILIFIIVGGKIFGVGGILLAIPCAAILHYVYKESVIPKMERRKKAKFGEDPMKIGVKDSFDGVSAEDAVSGVLSEEMEKTEAEPKTSVSEEDKKNRKGKKEKSKA